MKKVVLGILIAVLALGIVAFIRLSAPGANESINEVNSESNSGNSQAVSGTTNSGSSGSSNSINSNTLSEHDSASDCWVGYDGKVYDVTSFLPNHEGSAAAIIPYCGTYDEFTQAFEGQHGKSKVSGLMRVGTLIGDFQIKGSV